jgi:paraquat-inducible protein B
VSKHASPAAIGGFVVTALALLVASVLFLSGGQLHRNAAHVIVYFEDSVDGLKVGAPVKFRGIEIGSVKDLRINMTGVTIDPNHVRLPVLLEIEQKRLNVRGALGVDLSDRQAVQQLVGLGLRAQLTYEAIITGVRSVELDFHPGAPAPLVHDPRYSEIPSLPSPTAGLADRVNHVVQNLEHVDFAGLVASVRKTFDDADRLLNGDVDRAVTQLSRAAGELQPTLKEVRDGAGSTRRAIDGLSNRADTALRDVSAAARSIRRLADQLSRDPGSLLRGGKQ